MSNTDEDYLRQMHFGYPFAALQRETHAVHHSVWDHPRMLVKVLSL